MGSRVGHRLGALSTAAAVAAGSIGWMFGELRLFKVEITSMLEDRALFVNILNYNDIVLILI